MASVNASLEPLLTISVSLNGSIAMDSSNLYETNLKDGTVFTRGLLDENVISLSKLAEIAKRINGVIVKEDAEYIRIGVDPFRTIPLFFCVHNGILVSSDIRACIGKKSEIELDAAGFWESIKYGICLGTRTLFNGVNQLIGASLLKICKSDLSYDVESYWDYRVSGMLECKSMSQAVSGLDRILRKAVTRKLNEASDRKFIMGVSGGLDSRLSLNYLSTLLTSEELKLFTFANDRRSLEYVYAKQVTEATDFKEPIFVTLDESYYRKSFSDLPVLSAGQMNLIHGHISNCLSKLSNAHSKKSIQISNYFSDALFGWCCISQEEDALVGFEDMVSGIRYDEDIPREIQSVIINDLDDLFSRGRFAEKGNGPFSTFFEYFYLVEKNVKMHSYLMHLQSTLQPVLALYADYDLAEYMLSMPIKYRRGKDVVDHLLMSRSNFSGKNIPDVSSRDFRGATGKLSWKTLKGIGFKLRVRVNAVSALFGLQGGWLKSRFQTEDIQSVYHRLFRQEIVDARNYLVDRGVIDARTASSRFRTLKIRPRGIGENMQLLSVVKGIHDVYHTSSCQLNEWQDFCGCDKHQTKVDV